MGGGVSKGNGCGNPSRRIAGSSPRGDSPDAAAPHAPVAAVEGHSRILRRHSVATRDPDKAFTYRFDRDFACLVAILVQHCGIRGEGTPRFYGFSTQPFVQQCLSWHAAFHLASHRYRSAMHVLVVRLMYSPQNFSMLAGLHQFCARRVVADLAFWICWLGRVTGSAANSMPF